MAFNKPCVVCGKLSRGSRCAEHQAEVDQRKQAAKNSDPTYQAKKAALYDSAYRRQRKHLKATATTCHICGKAFTPTDQIDIDHITATPGSPLAPAHAYCNRSKGNK